MDDVYSTEGSGYHPVLSRWLGISTPLALGQVSTLTFHLGSSELCQANSPLFLQLFNINVFLWHGNVREDSEFAAVSIWNGDKNMPLLLLLRLGALFCPTLCNPLDCKPPGSSVHDDSLGNTGVGCLALLQGIFPTQGSNLDLPQCRWILYQLSHQGNPRILEWVAYPFSRGSFRPRNWMQLSCIAAGFFTVCKPTTAHAWYLLLSLHILVVYEMLYTCYS